jgi:heptosyltransferase-2
MGDVVLTTALPRLLRKAYPEARIDFITDVNYSEIYEFNPRIDNLINYDKAMSAKEIAEKKKRVLDLSDGGYDFIVDLHNNLRTLAFCSGLGKKIFRIKKRRLK